MYYARIRENNLQLNPQESIIYIPNKDPIYSAPLAMNMYFLRTIPAEIFTENVQQSDDCIDNFLADTFCFHENSVQTVNSLCYAKASNQIRLGIRNIWFWMFTETSHC